MAIAKSVNNCALIFKNVHFPQWSFIFIFVQEIILILKVVKFFLALGLSILGNGKNIKRTAFLRSKKVEKRP
jgi:hypothetical protein